MRVLLRLSESEHVPRVTVTFILSPRPGGMPSGVHIQASRPRTRDEGQDVEQQPTEVAGALPSYKGYHMFPCVNMPLGQRAGALRRPEPPTGAPPTLACCRSAAGAILDGWRGDAVVTVYIGTRRGRYVVVFGLSRCAECRNGSRLDPLAGSPTFPCRGVRVAGRCARPWDVLRDRGRLRWPLHRHHHGHDPFRVAGPCGQRQAAADDFGATICFEWRMTYCRVMS